MASKNASIVDEWLEDDNLMLLEAWSRDGYTKQDIADRIGVHVTTLMKWETCYPEIKEALRKGREIIDYKVENALLKRALGYTSKEIKVTVGKQQKNGQTFEITKETTVREVAPDVTACAIWLNNRRPDKWKRNRDKVVELEEDDSNLQITIVRGPKASEELENTNQEITISTKGHNKEEHVKLSSKGDTLKEDVDDVDYWPDDWEEEEE